MDHFNWILACKAKEAEEREREREQAYHQASEGYDINSFAYFSCNFGNRGYVRRVRADLVLSEENVKTHACGRDIEIVMGALRKNPKLGPLLEGKHVNFTFEMIETDDRKERQPSAYDSSSMQAAIVASIINLLLPEKNCNHFVATGAINSDGEVKRVQGVRLKLNAAIDRNLKFVLPESNREEIPEEQLPNCHFIESIDDLLQLVDPDI